MLTGSRAAAAGGFTAVHAMANIVAGGRHGGRRRAGAGARGARRLRHRAPDRRRHRRGSQGTHLVRDRRDGAVPRRGPGVLRRRQVRRRRAADASRARVRQDLRRRDRPARAGAAPHRRRPDERGRAVAPNSASRAGPRSPRRRSSPATCCSPSTSARACTSATSRRRAASTSSAGRRRAASTSRPRSPRTTCCSPRTSCRGYDARYKVNPPLRRDEDVQALRAALADGTIDIVATDHAPHPVEAKECEWARRRERHGRPRVRPERRARSRWSTTGLLDWADVARVLSTRPGRDRPARRATATPFAVGCARPSSRSTTPPRAATFGVDRPARQEHQLALPRRELPGRVVATFHSGCPTVLDGAARRQRDRRGTGSGGRVATACGDRHAGCSARSSCSRVAALFLADGPRLAARSRRQAEAVRPVPVPADRGLGGRASRPTASTSRRPAPTQPLDRIAVGGLGFRGRGGRDACTPTGVVLDIAGWTTGAHPGAPRSAASAGPPGPSTASSSPAAWSRCDWTALGAQQRRTRHLLPRSRRRPRRAHRPRTGDDARLPADRGRRDDLMTTDPAVLVLEDGTRYAGRAYGARGRTLGEAVFATGMTGYQETLTDPSYAGQIVVHDRAAHRQHRHERRGPRVAPHLGRRLRRARPQPRRLELPRDAQPRRRPGRATASSASRGIDTRAVTRHLRDAAPMRGGVFAGADAALDADEQLAIVARAADMAGRNLSRRGLHGRGVRRRRRSGERIGTLAVLDLGVKPSTRRLPRRSAASRCTCCRRASRSSELPRARPRRRSSTRTAPATRRPRDAHVDPAARRAPRRAARSSASASATSCSAARSASAPTSCRSATAASTSRCSTRRTGKVEITSQNHGFAVDAPLEGVFERPDGFGRVEVSHYRLNDNVVEGLRALDIPAFSVQYHPEAAAGPHDGNYLFDRFRDMVRVERSIERRATPPTDAAPTPRRRATDAQARRHQSVLVIGSGPIVIGQAAEFDYSGTQACRVLRAEGVRVILVNPNPATIMTDPDFADATYIEPITTEVARDDHREGAAGCGAADPRRPDRAERGDRPRRGRHPREVRRRADRRQGRGDPEGRGPPDLQGARHRGRRRRGAQPHRAHRRRGGRRSPTTSATRWSSARRSRWAASAPASRYDRGRARSAWSATACTRARRPRCCSRSRSSAGRSTSSSSCATPPTTRSSSARSRTSTRSACTPATRSPSPRR